MSTLPPTIACIDIGSGAIKGVRRHGTGAIMVRDTRPLKSVMSVADDVAACLEALAAGTGSGIPVRISSSMRGGINAGILSLSRSVSGAAVARTLELAGARIDYHVQWHEPPDTALEPVDLLVVAGGIDRFKPDTVRAGLAALSPHLYPASTIAYAGHVEAVDAARQRWPSLVVLQNPATTGPPSLNADLAALVSRLVAEDVIHVSKLGEVRRMTDSAILPTHRAVSAAFQQMARTDGCEAILIDVGSTTTDLHFMTAAGSASWITCPYGIGHPAGIAARLADVDSIDLLEALYGVLHREAFASLQHGELPSGLADKACLWLALKAASDTIPIEAVGTLLVTGGGACALTIDDVGACLTAATGVTRRAKVIIDSEHEWWSTGLALQQRASATRMETSNG